MRWNYRRFGFIPAVLVAGIAMSCAVADDVREPALDKEGTRAATGDDAALVLAQADDESQEATDAEPIYSVECGHVNEDGESFCYVDRATYIGWRTYHGFCHVCHAQDAVGSTFAPSLLERMRQPDMSKDLFKERLANGFTGQVGVMPPWKDNPNVSKRYNELYAYLMARASGDLPPGRPERKPKSD